MAQSRTVERRYRQYPGMIFDADVRSWLDARQSVNDKPAPTWAAAVNRAVLRLKNTPSLVSGLSNWSAIDSLVIPVQANLLAGALKPLKGSCTNFNFVQGDLVANGMKGLSASQKSLGLGTSRVNPNASMGVWAWGPLVTSGLIGRVSNLSIIVLGTGPSNITYRSFSNVAITVPAFQGLIGWSRLNTNEVHHTVSRSAVETTALAATAAPAAGTLSGFQVGGSFAWTNATLGLMWHGQAVNIATVQTIFNELMLPYFGG